MLTVDYVGPADPAAYCLVLHGLGDSMAGWKGVVPELGLSDVGFLFVNAPEPYLGGYSWFPYPGINADPDDPHATANGVRHSRGLLAKTIKGLMNRYDFSPDRLFLLGFSQGCVMVLDHALRSDECYAGVVGISGACLLLEEYPDAFGSVVRQQQILMTHGRYDDVIPISSTRAQANALQEMDVQLEWREYDKAHGVDPYQELGDIRAWMTAHVPS